jgi:hypothetical protein
MNQERISTSTGSTGESIRSFGSLRSRYHAFLEKRKEQTSPSKSARFGQGLASVAIFSGLFVVILTVFGIGLSWFSRGWQKETSDQSNTPATKSVMIERSAGIPPAQPAGPAGHAEVRSQSPANKKTDDK